jgi:conjugal transfer mating pair stabilization protein TraG
MMAWTVYTYGGGEILRNIFNSIAIMTTGGLFQSLLVIGMACGAFWVLAKSFFSPQIETIFLRFFLPAIAITCLLMLPKSKVHIEDAYTRAPIVIDNVPWLIAKPAEIISTLGYRITEGFENVMHVPNDLRYCKTGMVFGSETAMDMKKYRLSNATLEQNLKKFSKQCVFYDLALNKYTLDQFKRSTNLWSFLESNTSKVRMIPYADPVDAKKGVVYLNCQNAVKVMKPLFENEKNYCAKQDIAKNLPLTFQALTGLRKDKEELISQQLMMQLFEGELGSENFAKSRAYMQQKSTYHVLGSLASSSLVTMRAILEGFIYSAAIFVIPLSVLPGGFSFITNWLWMLIWIQLWPPFYAITNYIIQILSQGQAKAIIEGLSASDRGLSFFTSSGLAQLHDDMFALSGYMALLVPFISYAVIKGGISSFIHLSSSLTSPGQSAASSAAAEQATGNYNFANASFGQTSYENTTAQQNNQAPSLSSGYFTENTGSLSTTYTPDETLLKHHSSELRWGVSSDSAITESFQQAQQSSQAYTENQQKSYMESISTQARNLSDLTTHLSQGQNYNENVSEREAFDIQESARFLKNEAHNLSQQYGISEHESMSLLVGGNIPAIGGASYGRNSTTDEAANTATNISKGEDFQKHLQNVSDFAKTKAHTALNDEGVRLAESTSQSIDETANAQKHYSAAKSQSEQLSETASWAQQNTQNIRKALNQDLVNWSIDNKGYEEGKRILTNGSDPERSALISDFISSLHTQGSFNGALDVNQKYEQANIPSIEGEAERSNLYINSMQTAQSQGFDRSFVTDKAQEMEANHARSSESVQSEVQATSRKLGNSRTASNIQQYIDDKVPLKESIQSITDFVIKPIDQASDFALRLYDGPVNQVKLSGKYTEPPLGWKE